MALLPTYDASRRSKTGSSFPATAAAFILMALIATTLHDTASADLGDFMEGFGEVAKGNILEGAKQIHENCPIKKAAEEAAQKAAEIGKKIHEECPIKKAAEAAAKARAAAAAKAEASRDVDDNDTTNINVNLNQHVTGGQTTNTASSHQARQTVNQHTGTGGHEGGHKSTTTTTTRTSKQRNGHTDQSEHHDQHADSTHQEEAPRRSSTTTHTTTRTSQQRHGHNEQHDHRDDQHADSHHREETPRRSTTTTTTRTNQQRPMYSRPVPPWQRQEPTPYYDYGRYYEEISRLDSYYKQIAAQLKEKYEQAELRLEKYEEQLAFLLRDAADDLKRSVPVIPAVGNHDSYFGYAQRHYDQISGPDRRHEPYYGYDRHYEEISRLDAEDHHQRTGVVDYSYPGYYEHWDRRHRLHYNPYHPVHQECRHELFYSDHRLALPYPWQPQPLPVGPCCHQERCYSHVHNDCRHFVGNGCCSSPLPQPLPLPLPPIPQPLPLPLPPIPQPLPLPPPVPVCCDDHLRSCISHCVHHA